ncbi:hypothetical protein ACOMHN_016932 [Nucella lapillus]
MADEEDRRQAAEELEAREEGGGEPQQLEARNEDKGDTDTVTVDSVVDAFFASEGEPNDSKAGKGQSDAEWSSEEEDREGKAQAPDTDKPAEAVSAQTGGDGNGTVPDAAQSAEELQKAEAEAESNPQQREDGEEVSFDVEGTPSPEQKREKDDFNADNSFEEEGTGGKGDQIKPERSSTTAVPPPAQTSTLSPGNTDGKSRNAEEEEERSEEKVQEEEMNSTGNNNNQTEEPLLATGSDPSQEAEDLKTAGEESPHEGQQGVQDLNTVEDSAQQGVQAVAQDIVQQVLDRAMTAETDAAKEDAETGQETDPNFTELDKVDIHSGSWGSEDLGSEKDAADLDREQDIADKPPSDSEQIPEVVEDVKEEEVEEDGYGSEGERELQGESQELYQYADEHTPPPSPRSQVSDGVPDSTDQPPAPAHINASASSSHHQPPPQDLSEPMRSSTSIPKQPSSRDHPERPREAEESHDGSYLWLQRQVQWRAGSSEMPDVKSLRESTRVDHHVTSPGSGYTGWREERRSGDGRLNVSGEERVGTSVSDLSGSLTSPGAIPNFNTLRDQQVSWLSMYRMLEEQHKSELQTQYTEHQQMINDMQHHLEGKLLSQQETMRQKLDSHREALKDASYSSYSRHQNSNNSGRYNNKHSSQGDNSALPSFSSSSSPLQHREIDTNASVHQYPGRSTQRVSRDTARSSPEMAREKRLRGGVYSSPMPTAKLRASSRERSSYEGDSEDRFAGSLRLERGGRLEEDYSSDGRQLPTQQLSPRSHQNLRDKHSKHLSDLRSYYEAEIQDLRQKLGAEGLRLSSSTSAVGVGRDRTREGLLQEENQMLRLQLRDLQDTLHDSQIYSRDLEQKLQGLEIRATDYASRYEESQVTVLQLKNRLEELHSYAKDRESVLEQVQASERRQTLTLQDLYKAKEEQEETARRNTSTIKKLLDKYEMLEKDYSSLKETCADFEQRLFDTRSEAVQLNKTISQFELENKRLTHDNDNMRHRLAISGSLPMMRQELAESGSHRGGYENLNGYPSASSAYTHLETHSARSGMGRDTTPPRRPPSDEDPASHGKSDSPLLRAERELRRLQQTLEHGEFIPRLQPKKYTGSLCPASGEVTIIDAFSSSARSAGLADTGSKEKRGKKPGNQLTIKQERGGGTQSKQSLGRSPQKVSLNGDSTHGSGVSSPTRFDVGVLNPQAQSSGTSGGASSAAANKARIKAAVAERKEEMKSSGNSVSKSGDGQRVDAMLERIRCGEFVSRPQWEDVYTSLAKPADGDKTTAINMTQEEMLRDRMRSIEQMERRYDDLQIEKRKLESQLNKVPMHGRDRKSRREKELLEEKLDSVDRELGSVRMTLKHYQVLKTAM